MYLALLYGDQLPLNLFTFVHRRGDRSDQCLNLGGSWSDERSGRRRPGSSMDDSWHHEEFPSIGDYGDHGKENDKHTSSLERQSSFCKASAGMLSSSSSSGTLWWCRVSNDSSIYKVHHDNDNGDDEDGVGRWLTTVLDFASWPFASSLRALWPSRTNSSSLDVSSMFTWGQKCLRKCFPFANIL